MFVNVSLANLGTIAKLDRALKEKNLIELKVKITNLIKHALSYWSIDKNLYKEKTYQLILSGFLYGLEGSYLLLSEKESGYGRPDIVLEPINKNDPGYIFELKIKDNKEDSLKQIENKDYDSELKRRGVNTIVKMGLIFDGKKVEFVD